MLSWRRGTTSRRETRGNRHLISILASRPDLYRFSVSDDAWLLEVVRKHRKFGAAEQNRNIHIPTEKNIMRIHDKSISYPLGLW